MNRTVLFLKRVRRRLACQDGFALAMAIGTSMVFGIVGSTVAAYATENAGAASHSSSDQSAYALAEAGINNSLAILYLRTNNPLNPYLLPARVNAYDGGTVTWSGALDEVTGVWTLTSVGTVRNPTGPTVAPIERRLTGQILVSPAPAQPVASQSWNYVYSRQTGFTCDMSIGNSVQLASPLYVNGNLCLSNLAAITRGPLVVNGQLSMSQSANTVGSAATPVGEAHIVKYCKWYTGVAHTPCKNGAGTSGNDNVFATKLDAVAGTVPAPALSLDTWYLNASPGPYFPCAVSSGTTPTFDNDQGPRTAPDATKRNDSLNTTGVVDLTPTLSYTCRTDNGELSWNAISRVLTIAGTIFIDGSAKVTNALVDSYSGQASLYLSGTFYMKNSKLCAVLSADGTTCTTTGWTPDSRLLAVVANGTGAWGGAAAQVLPGDSIQLVNSYFQGALYGTYAVDVDTTSQVDGPIDGSTVKIGQSAGTSLPTISLVPASMPGNDVVYGQPGGLQGYSG